MLYKIRTRGVIPIINRVGPISSPIYLSDDVVDILRAKGIDVIEADPVNLGKEGVTGIYLPPDKEPHNVVFGESISSIKKITEFEEGIGETLIAGRVGSTVYLKKINSGTNIIPTPTDVDLTLSAIGGGGGVSGSVFITDVTPINSWDQISDKVFNPECHTLVSFKTNATLVRVHILALTGSGTFQPVVYVNTQKVNLTPDVDKPLFVGTIDVDVTGLEEITAIHSGGDEYTVSFTDLLQPLILNASFLNAYPDSQTELKQGDSLTLQFDVDSDINHVELDNYGPSSGQTFTIPNGSSGQVTFNVANRGNTTQSFSCRFRVANIDNVFSEWIDTLDFGATDGVQVVNLNNLHPTITFNNITYPVDQSAIKNGEFVEINHSITNFDSVVYSSPNSQIGFSSPNEYSTSKEAYRVSGNYNDNTDNVRISATRVANGATSINDLLVKIAHVAPSVSVDLPFSRLRSGGNDGTVAQDYTVTVISNQNLAQSPTFTAPSGSLNPIFSGSNKLWTSTISIHDNDSKGTFEWENIEFVNEAGVSANVINTGSQYILGGFVSRTVTLEAFLHDAPINVMVTDYTKVIDPVWSYGGGYELNNARALDTPYGVPYFKGWCIADITSNSSIVRVLDVNAVNSSSSDTSITIEETV